MLVQVDEGTHSAWKARAFSEGRSMSDLARQLIEAAVLTERVHGRSEVAAVLGSAAAAVPLGDESTGPDVSPATSSIRSVSSVPPPVHDVPVEKSVAARSWRTSEEAGDAARGLASHNGKCSADVARGTKCKLCGKAH